MQEEPEFHPETLEKEGESSPERKHLGKTKAFILGASAALFGVQEAGAQQAHPHSSPKSGTHAPVPKPYRPGDLRETSMYTEEYSTPAKQRVEFTDSTLMGPVLVENMGDARAFIRNNISHFYTWLMKKENRTHMKEGDWQRQQRRWENIKVLMNEAAESSNSESGSHDQVVFPEAYRIVDMVMNRNLSEVDETIKALGNMETH